MCLFRLIKLRCSENRAIALRRKQKERAARSSMVLLVVPVSTWNFQNHCTHVTRDATRAWALQFLFLVFHRIASPVLSGASCGSLSGPSKKDKWQLPVVVLTCRRRPYPRHIQPLGQKMSCSFGPGFTSTRTKMNTAKETLKLLIVPSPLWTSEFVRRFHLLSPQRPRPNTPSLITLAIEPNSGNRLYINTFCSDWDGTTAEDG